uniref:NIF system FeS cluster assembly NifU C-terminal domain-containing protein n=1 Tax=Lotharella globosa TaxID=91324 RepID=A0A7S3YDD5_9EUKA
MQSSISFWHSEIIFLLKDGGDIAYRGFSNSVVYVELRGSCVGCPSSSVIEKHVAVLVILSQVLPHQVTLKQGVQNMLMHYVPEVMGVEEIGPDEVVDEESGNQQETVVDKSHFDRLKDLGF